MNARVFAAVVAVAVVLCGGVFGNGIPAESGPDPPMWPRMLWAVEADGPAFLHVAPEGLFSEPSLLVSQFPFPIGVNQVSYMTGLGDLDVAPLGVTPIMEVVWPNGIAFLDGLATKEPIKGFIVCSGFMFNPGHLTLVDMTEANAPPALYQLTAKPNVFYHQAIWLDVDGDGVEDLITARANTIGFFPPGQIPSRFELVALLQPADDPLASTPWPEVVLATGGADVHFTYDEEANTIYAAAFFSQALLEYTQASKNGVWVDGAVADPIDVDLGSPFDLELVDLNKDGVKDLLVTNHEASPAEAKVFAYDGASGFKVRHTLASGFPLENNEPGQGSPGEAIAFYPETGKTDGKPWIALAGDAAWSAYILYPLSDDSSDWTYGVRNILFTGGTVGSLAVGDLNGDGWSDLFIPAYDTDFIYAMTFAPEDDNKADLHVGCANGQDSACPIVDGCVMISFEPTDKDRGNVQQRYELAFRARIPIGATVPWIKYNEVFQSSPAQICLPRDIKPGTVAQAAIRMSLWDDEWSEWSVSGRLDFV